MWVSQYSLQGTAVWEIHAEPRPANIWSGRENSSPLRPGIRQSWPGWPVK